MKKEGKKIPLSTYIISLIMMAIICGALVYLNVTGVLWNKESRKEPVEQKTEVKVPEISKESEEQVKNKIVGHKLCDFDLSFLKEENKEENKIYSPLSIKAALKMLEESTEGESKKQISNYIGEYTPTKYVSNSNMAFANAMFVRDSFTIKDAYKSTLKSKYNAEAISDSFKTASNVNSWVKKNTLNLIDNLLDDIDEGTNFILINALGIDMEWKDRFLTFEDGRH